MIVGDGRGIELAAGQIAAIDGHAGRFAGFDGTGKDGIDPRGSADAEAIVMQGAALGMSEMIETNVVIAALGQDAIGDGVGVVVIAAGRQLFTFAVVYFQAGMKAAIDAGSEAAEDDTLALFASENVVIDIGGVGHRAVDGRIAFNALGLLDIIVR